MIALGGALLAGADLLLWVLWATRWLLLVAAVALAVAAWNRRRRRLPVLSARQVVRGAVISDDAELDRVELRRLRDENSAMRKKIQVLSEMISGPKARP
jgi:hypothetical protein